MSLNKFLIPKFTLISLPLFFICKWHQHLQLFKPPNWKLYLFPSFSIVHTSNSSANFLYSAFKLHLKSPYFSPSPLPPPWSAALWVTATACMSVPVRLSSLPTFSYSSQNKHVKPKGDRLFPCFTSLNGSPLWYDEFINFFPWSKRPCMCPSHNSLGAILPAHVLITLVSFKVREHAKFFPASGPLYMLPLPMTDWNALWAVGCFSFFKSPLKNHPTWF